MKEISRVERKRILMSTTRGVLNRLLIRNTRVDSEETRVHVSSQAIHQSPKQ